MQLVASLTYGESRPIAELERLIQLRMKRCGEFVEDATAATMLDALRSIRAITKKAKAGRIPKPKVTKMPLVPGWYTPTPGGKYAKSDKRAYKKKDKVVARMCIRNHAGHRINPRGLGAVANFSAMHGVRGKDYSNSGIYGFQYVVRGRVASADPIDFKRSRNYMIAAPSEAKAATVARDILKRMAMRFAGLARAAISTLMQKAWLDQFGDGASDPVHIRKVAQAVTTVEHTVLSANLANGKVYELAVRDSLDYAMKAVEGGQSGIDLALSRAANKVAGMIRHRLGDDLSHDIQTPFPELVKARNAA